MNIKLKFGKRKVNLAVLKVEWVYGVSSKVPDSDEHFLLFDVDDYSCLPDFIGFLIKEGLVVCPHFIYRTPHGFHYICLKRLSFLDTAKLLLSCPCIDFTWFSVGLKRGYWFLRSWTPVPFKEMSHMRIAMELKPTL